MYATIRVVPFIQESFVVSNLFFLGLLCGFYLLVKFASRCPKCKSWRKFVVTDQFEYMYCKKCEQTAPF